MNKSVSNEKNSKPEVFTNSAPRIIRDLSPESKIMKSHRVKTSPFSSKEQLMVACLSARSDEKIRNHNHSPNYNQVS